MKPTAQSFISGFPWTLPILWQGKSGTYVMDADRRATIGLAERGIQHQFQGVKVEITSKTSGLIVSKWFGFDEYLTDRADDRADYPIGKDACFMVLAYCGWEWYIAVPKHPEFFTREVEKWIALWL